MTAEMELQRLRARLETEPDLLLRSDCRKAIAQLTIANKYIP
jgi:hypothetical protein